MDHELQKLLDDPRFLRYHAAVVKPRTFNPFDVLKYSDYEIRHSNVLAWLLQPDETHGIGGAFIRDFAAALNEQARAQGVPPIPVPSSFEADNIRVERERYYVDITLFFLKERTVVAIENKTDETAPEYAEQVRYYEKTLREKDPGKYDVVQSVLLTTSREPDASSGDFIHLSWARVRDLVDSIRKRERFPSEEGEKIRAFLGQYLEIVARLIAQPETESDQSGTLLDEYGHVLDGLLTEREDRAGSADLVSLANDLGEYKVAVDRLVNDFRQKPRQLRSDVQARLRGEGFRTWTSTSSAYQTYYLYFSNAGMEETRKSLGLSWHPRWSIIFGRREVLLQLQIDPPKKEWGPAVDRIIDFMKQHPIDASQGRRGRYPLDRASWSAGCFLVYKHSLMTDACPPRQRWRSLTPRCGRWRVSLTRTTAGSKPTCSAWPSTLRFQRRGSQRLSRGLGGLGGGGGGVARPGRGGLPEPSQRLSPASTIGTRSDGSGFGGAPWCR